MNAPIVCIIILNRTIGLSSGKVMLKNFRIGFAPSTPAASYISVGIFLRPARKISMDEPNCHTDREISITRDAFGSPNQLIGPIPIAVRALLITPSLLKRLRHIMDTATLPPIMDGR
ncbi:hypothetical protein D3C76_1142720 [compost metagenome]